MNAQRRVIERGRDAVYHCVTRTVNGEIWLNDEEKAFLRCQIQRVAAFSGVQILTYCIMSNHFHLLVRVPQKDRADAKVDDRELLRRYRALYPKPCKYQQTQIAVLESILQAGGPAAEDARARLLRRMHDLGAFMQAVKQRFSVWYNERHKRFGTLWSERYKSVLVQGKGNPLLMVALYIDLNPVRAELVEDPKDYRFCGYAEAVAGNEACASGLRTIVSSFAGEDPDDVLWFYRRRLFGKGSRSRSGKVSGKISRQKALEVLEGDGALECHEALRCKINSFSSGGVLGEADFVLAYTALRNNAPVAFCDGVFGGLYMQHHIRKPAFA